MKHFVEEDEGFFGWGVQAGVQMGDGAAGGSGDLPSHIWLRGLRAYGLRCTSWASSAWCRDSRERAEVWWCDGLALEVTWHFCHTWLGEAATALPRFKGWEPRCPHFLGGVSKSYFKKSTWDGRYCCISLENSVPQLIIRYCHYLMPKLSHIWLVGTSSSWLLWNLFDIYSPFFD